MGTTSSRRTTSTRSSLGAGQLAACFASLATPRPGRTGGGIDPLARSLASPTTVDT